MTRLTFGILYSQNCQNHPHSRCKSLQNIISTSDCTASKSQLLLSSMSQGWILWKILEKFAEKLYLYDKDKCKCLLRKFLVQRIRYTISRCSLKSRTFVYTRWKIVRQTTVSVSLSFKILIFCPDFIVLLVIHFKLYRFCRKFEISDPDVSKLQVYVSELHCINRISHEESDDPIGLNQFYIGHDEIVKQML